MTETEKWINESLKSLPHLCAEVRRLSEENDALRARLEKEAVNPPSNDPLTREQLREMNGEPYWHVGLQDDSPPPHWTILDPFIAKHIEDYGYGVRWLAFRCKPEEGDT